MKQLHPESFNIQEVQIIYKRKFKVSERPKVTCSADSYSLFMSTWNSEIMGFIEQFKILLLNRANRVLGIYEVSYGGICGTVADPRVIYAAALKTCATGIILCHNHPSENLKPSQPDIMLTQKLKEGGRLLDVEILDHLIIAPNSYFSFADEGYLKQSSKMTVRIVKNLSDGHN